jgi:hypothetical protein
LTTVSSNLRIIGAEAITFYNDLYARYCHIPRHSVPLATSRDMRRSLRDWPGYVIAHGRMPCIISQSKKNGSSRGLLRHDAVSNLKSYQIYHGLPTVYVCFMHNTLSLKVFGFWDGANIS